MTDTRNAKSWPRVFADGQGLFGALLSIVELVDGDIGAEGGHLRELYAEFLDDAAGILGRPALADAANAWRAVGDLWEDFADAAVPDDIPELADAVDAGEALHAAAMAGEQGRPGVREAAQRLWTARRTFADAFPAGPDRVEDLLADLGLRMATIFEAERDALARTAAAARAR
ncbi:MAG: DUF4872 domain-containing protein [Chloroflexi bacterium]|nr:DUF4872 domain-containing protein [Chloroflexota bacterium]